MAGPALYELLTGHFADGVAIDAVDPNTQTILSVMDSIQRILNARAGSLAHLPEYGLPDLTTLYRELPASAHQLKRTMEATLKLFEPRLLSVEIELQPAVDEAILSYTLVCHLKQAGLVRFGTYFMPEGRVWLNRVHT
ncbi:type VI secretion system baseplate subunit TssE [Amantichitinum ursilacus]|uniref:Gene 25-like lysozyme n=1 Tax=Amantichitinum ursilacus TaxID=857265 RepID=A0A0N0GND4_9NEIS|nr:type VI secretion system baseplate subunit TssE [Amantichitinum ursilacus]KPC52615.1 Gene 25-like lysozyme [Amantichitinum ursilacus]